MADISKEIKDFKDAIYGEDIRDSLVSMATKLNEAVEGSAKAAADSATTAENSKTAAGNFASNAQESAAAALEAYDSVVEARNGVEDMLANTRDHAEAAKSSAQSAKDWSEGIDQALAEAKEAANNAKESETNAFSYMGACGTTLEKVRDWIVDSNHIIKNVTVNNYLKAESEIKKGELIFVAGTGNYNEGFYVMKESVGTGSSFQQPIPIKFGGTYGLVTDGSSTGVTIRPGLVPAFEFDIDRGVPVNPGQTLQVEGWGKKLQVDIVVQNGKCGFINPSGSFIAFSGQ